MRPRRCLGRAREIAGEADDPGLTVRVRLIEGVWDLLTGHETARNAVLSTLAAGPRHIDVTYSSGYTSLTYFDVEQRRLGLASDLLDTSIPLMVEHDLPICHVVQMGSRSRLQAAGRRLG